MVGLRADGVHSGHYHLYLIRNKNQDVSPFLINFLAKLR